MRTSKSPPIQAQSAGVQNTSPSWGKKSCDSSTPETYAKIRGVNVLPKVLKNVGEMIQTRTRLGAERPRVSLWFTGVKDNIRELPGLVDIAGQMGVDEVYLTRMVFFGEGLATEDQSIFNAEEALRRQVEDIVADADRRAAGHGLSFKSAGAIAPSEYASGPGEVRNPWQGCRRPWRLGYVTANGNALPCCVAPFTDVPYDDLILGNVKDGGFNAVWNGERFRGFETGRHRAIGTGQNLMVFDVQRAQPALLAHGDGDKIADLDQLRLAEMLVQAGP